MKELSVTKYSNFILYQNNIRFSKQFPIIFSIPDTLCKQCLSQHYFYLSIFRTNILHIFSTLFFSQNIHRNHPSHSNNSLISITCIKIASKTFTTILFPAILISLLSENNFLFFAISKLLFISIS